MVKRILENERYLRMDYPRLVTDEEFLAVRLRRREQEYLRSMPKRSSPYGTKQSALSAEKR